MVERKDEFLIFKQLFIYLRRVNCAPKPGKKFSLYFSLRSLLPLAACLMPIYIGLWGHLIRSIKDHSISLMIKDLYFMVVITMYITLVTSFQIFGNEMLGLIKRFEKFNFGTPPRFNMMKKYLDIFTTVWYIMVLFVLSTYLVFKLFWDPDCYIRKEEENSSGYVCNLACPAWYPLKMDIFLWKFVLFANSVLAVCFYSPYLSTGTMFYYGCVFLIVDRMEQIKKFLKGFPTTEKDRELKKQKLETCIKAYAEMSELTTLVNNTLGYVFAPAQNFSTTIIIALLEYLTVVEKDYLAFLHLMLWISSQAVICFAGQIMEDASTSLRIMVYELSWYELDLSMMKDFRIFHAQVQKTIHLKMQPLLRMNLEHLLEISKSSYSILMYMVRLNE